MNAQSNLDLQRPGPGGIGHKDHAKIGIIILLGWRSSCGLDDLPFGRTCPALLRKQEFLALVYERKIF